MDPYLSSEVATTGQITVIGYDILTPFLGWFLSEASDTGVSGVVTFFGTLWTTYVVLAYLVSALLLSLYVYATIRKGQLEELQEELLHKGEKMFDEQYRSGPKNDRLEDIVSHIASDNPNDWKLAIIEADIVLDETLKRAGYGGVSLGERLRSISPAQLRSLDDAWQAHKIRNQIAHGGADFVLTKRLAEDTIKQYRRTFEELGV